MGLAFTVHVISVVLLAVPLSFQHIPVGRIVTRIVTVVEHQVNAEHHLAQIYASTRRFRDCTPDGQLTWHKPAHYFVALAL